MSGTGRDAVPFAAHLDNSYCRGVEQRPKYPATQLTLGLIGGENADDWWAEVRFSGEGERNAWRSVYELYFGSLGAHTHPRRAARLAQYGWTPGELERALQTQGRMLQLPVNEEMPSREQGRREVRMDEASVEASAALVYEVGLFVESARVASSYARDRYLWALSRSGWNHSQLGELFGLTKQRVQQLLNRPGRRRA